MQIEVSPKDKLDQLTIKIFDVEDEEDVLEILSQREENTYIKKRKQDN